MKIHHVIILSTALALLLFSISLLRGKKLAQYENANMIYACKLQSACYDAAKTINISFIRDCAGVWDSHTARELTLEIFYKSLALSLDRDNSTRNEIAESTPIVILADNGGFYISYSAGFDRQGHVLVPATTDPRSVTSGLNAYAGTYAGATVHFFLSDYVEVILPSGEYLSGCRQDVYDNLPENVKENLSFFSSDTQFDEYRTEAVALRIEENLNYYLNTQLVNVDAYNTGYQVSVPRQDGEYWARSIKGPSIIAFFQGEQDYLNGKLLSSYAYAAGEMSACDLYFIHNGFYYRVNDSLDIQKVLENGIYKYVYNGTQINQFYTSMAECAATGAAPAEQIFSQ